MSESLQLINEVLSVARTLHHRRLIVISGNDDWVYALCEQILLEQGISDFVAISHNTDWFKDAIPQSRFRSILGTETHYLVFDALKSLNPDAFGAVSGTVQGGGLLILLVPEFSHWIASPDEFVKGFYGAPNSNADCENYFITRFVHALQSNPDVVCLTQSEQDVERALPSLNQQLSKNKQSPGFEKQAQAVEAILHVVHGHRRRPLVITADRGRGKSAALGMAAARLVSQGAKRIIVTAPHREAVDTLFRYAGMRLEDAHETAGGLQTDDAEIIFVAPDELCRNELECALLLVDEAGAIPTHILETLSTRYSRLVFSTTIHGYEGNGRGFALRFLKRLTQLCPGWKEVHLDAPIRWAEDDPVESFVNQILLLDAEPATVNDVDVNDCQFEYIDSETLFSDESLLKEIFGLLVLAHYQTRPYDLCFMLDAPNVRVFVLQFQGSIVAACIVALEGQIDDSLAVPIALGRRRLKGQVLPQLMAQYVADEGAVMDSYARIIRIAVLPQLQRKHLGTIMIDHLKALLSRQSIRYLGVNFGVSADVLEFWQSNGFQTVRLGIKKETSTGEYAALMFIALQDEKEAALERYHRRFTWQFFDMLSDPFDELEPKIAFQLLQSTTSVFEWPAVKRDKSELVDYAFGNRGYEVTITPIRNLLRAVICSSHYSRIELNDVDICIRKVFQCQHWSSIVNDSEYKGRTEAQQHLKAIIRNVLLSVGDDEISRLLSCYQ